MKPGFLLLAVICLFGMQDLIAQPADSVKLVKLSFAFKDQVSSVQLNPAFKKYSRKSLYPLSLFITVNTVYHDKSGFPTPVEATAFHAIETELSKTLVSYPTCYIGKTMMNGYRDVIFYIRRQDQQKISRAMALLKLKYPRIQSYTFEVDPKWEAVAEFYKGL